MALDTRQDRMSAIMVALPFRGAMVDAAEAGFTQGNRQAAAFMYSGVLAAEGGGAPDAERDAFVGFMVDLGRMMRV